jgi:hypothetical protein
VGPKISQISRLIQKKKAVVKKTVSKMRLTANRTVNHLKVSGSG